MRFVKGNSPGSGSAWIECCDPIKAGISRPRSWEGRADGTHRPAPTTTRPKLSTTLICLESPTSMDIVGGEMEMELAAAVKRMVNPTPLLVWPPTVTITGMVPARGCLER